MKNYYFILGVSTSADPEEIKTAFRRRTMELHPDRSGPESGPFQELEEAYGVLSDPERRRKYDRHASSKPARRLPWGPVPEPLVSRPRGGMRDVSVKESFNSYVPSFEELFERLWGNFEPAPRPKGERLESLTVELVLNPEATLRGGRVRVRIPGKATCRICGGHGGLGMYECWQCEGHGAVAVDYPLDIEYPPGIADGHVVRLSLAPFGIENFYLNLVFRVSHEVPEEE